MMLEVFETEPVFAERYGDDEGLSTQLLQVYNNIEKTGGPFLKPLKYKNNDNVKIPDIRADLQKVQIDVLGFYRLKRIQLEETLTTYFCDLDILLVGAADWTQEEQAKAARFLKRLEEEGDTKKCCMSYTGSDPSKYQLNDFLYGYTRLIQWRDISSRYADWIFEGQLAGGYSHWTGYGRWMQLATAVGWWSKKDRLKGQGITHNGEHFENEGTWNGTIFFNPPVLLHKITDLS